jgi:hypothetical protein
MHPIAKLAVAAGVALMSAIPTRAFAQSELPTSGAPALLTAPRTAVPQKALVYCPVEVDDTGCNVIVGALSGTFAAVDKGYNGTAGTVDLATADLTEYAVAVIPSLSDNATSSPYGLLRDDAIAARLRGAFTGRVAIWSGTPDQGRGNREAKNTLLRSLARYAAELSDTRDVPGLLILQDASADVAARYNWLSGISGRVVSANPATKTFGRVRSLTGTGTRVLGNIAFANMASYGVVLPDGADWSAHAEGEVAASVSAPAGSGIISASLGALIERTVRRWAGALFAVNYVAFASSDNGNGSTAITLTRPATSVAGDLLVAHVVVPNHSTGGWVCAPAGWQQVAYHGWWDGLVQIVYAKTLAASGEPASYNWEFRANGNCASGALLSWAGTGAIAAYSGVDVAVPLDAFSTTVSAGASLVAPSVNTTRDSARVIRLYAMKAKTSLTTPAQTTSRYNVCSVGTNGRSLSSADGMQLTVGATGTATAASAGSSCGGGGANASADWSATTLVLRPSAVVRTTTTALALTSGVNPSTYGSSVTFTATVTALGGNPSSVGAVTFTDGATTLCSAVALSGNTASCTTAALAVSSHNITASYSGTTTGSPRFTASTSAQALSHTVTAKALTVGGVTASNKPYDGTTAATLVTNGASLNGVVGSDAVTLVTTNATGTFANKDVGTGKTVTVAGLTLSGTGAGNYSLTQPTTTADIQQRTLTASFTADSKAYDGTTAAVINGRSVSNKVGMEDVNITGGTATFDNATVGTGKTVTATGFTLAGADVANYSLGAVTSWTTTAAISQATAAFSNLSVSPITYGATTATVTGTLKTSGGLVPSGDVTATVATSGSGAAVSGVGSINASTGAFTVTVNNANLLVGSATGHEVTVSFAANANFAAASDNTLKLVVNKASQTITFPQPTTPAAFGSTVVVNATASSNLTVAIAASGACTILTTDSAAL